MSLFSALTASVSGMAAQSNKLSTISDNIANSSTAGYKEASTEFQDLIDQFSSTSYNANGVGTQVRYAISQQGNLTSTSSSTDLAIQGNGFFVVTDGSGSNYLTRAGSFTETADGELVNTAGYKLMGYSLTSRSSTPADGMNGLSIINLTANSLKAVPSTAGTFTANLQSNAATDTGTLPDANTSASTYTDKSSLVTYDNLGNAVTLDIYLTKTAANTWQMAAYNSAGAASGGGFPYSSPALSVQTLNFSATTGALTSPSSLSFTIPNGRALTLDVSGMTQLASSFSVATQSANGNAPSAVKSVSVSADGTVSEVYANGTEVPAYQIPLAAVPSINNLTPLAGDVYQAGAASGKITIGAAGSDGFGTIRSSELESSTVDLATQLTDMIVAQNGYQANSKAFQTGSDLLTALINIIK